MARSRSDTLRCTWPMCVPAGALGRCCSPAAGLLIAFDIIFPLFIVRIRFDKPAIPCKNCPVPELLCNYLDGTAEACAEGRLQADMQESHDLELMRRCLRRSTKVV